MADDIGWFNVSAYNMGIMGYRTPNIDRIAREGALFTDYYAEQSCTAGRSAFITGQIPLRTGLTKVGLPGSSIGLQSQDPTLAEILKPLGYVTGQFGKNHLGERDEYLPTVHGFDEFFGNLYHLNAEEADYPKDPEFRQRFGPRGVIRSYANPDGTQRVEDTGPLTIKRMKTVDEEFLAAGLDFIDGAHAAGNPFFVWFCPTRMHIWTHLKPELQGKTGLGIYADGMVENDGHVGRLLKKLDDLDIANNTIVVYTTDNGAEVFSWPDGGTTPFRSKKNTNREGGFRVPAMIRWPGGVKPGTMVNDVTSGLDWFPTLATAAGVAGIKENLLTGYQAGSKSFKVHLDGYDLGPALGGAAKEWPRKEVFYFTDDGDLACLRYRQALRHICRAKPPLGHHWERKLMSAPKTHRDQRSSVAVACPYSSSDRGRATLPTAADPRLPDVPTRAMSRLSGAAAVKDGRFLGPPAGLVLDGREHDGRLMRVGNDSGCLMAAFVVDGREIADR